MDFEKFIYTKKYLRSEKYYFLSFDFELHDITGHNRKTFDDCQSLLLFLINNPGKEIYLTLTQTNDFYEKNDKLVINLKSYQDFCKMIGQNGKNRTQAYLAQKLKHYSDDEKNRIIADSNEDQIIKRIRNFTEEEKINFYKKFEEIKDIKLLLPTTGNDLNLSNITIDQLLIELKKRNLNQRVFFDFADKFLNSKEIISIEELQKLTKSIDFKKTEKVIKIWESERSNSDEVGFWHKFLKENPWIISQVFAAPYAIFQNEFYIGGHYSGNRQGSKNTDYGYKNKFSQNIAIIEIKTPITDLVEKVEYDGRSGIYPMSKKLMGAISQVLNQKDLLHKDFNQNNRSKNFEVWNPKIILIIGSEENEKLNDDQRSCFELFRGSQKEIEIVTFDELFEKITNLRDVFNVKNDK